MENKKSLLRVRVRVTAKKRGRESKPCTASSSSKSLFHHTRSFNSVKKLHRREIGVSRKLPGGRSYNTQEKFRNFLLQLERMLEEFDMYDRGGHCFLSLPYLRRRTKIIEIVAAKDVIFALAQSGLCAAFSRKSLKWPGFVEFDDVNGKVLTYSAQDGAPGHVPLKILSIEDGTVLKSFNHLLHRNKKVDFIEQFNEKLLVKQENENLQILDVRNSELIEVSRTEFMTPSAFIFLYENHLFLTFRNRTVAVWNFRGELVTSFEDHLLWHPDCNTNNIYITSDQDLIISYCKAEEGSEDDGEVGPVGSINMSNILTGKCIAKICSNDPNLEVSPRGRMGRSWIRSTVREALEDVTALFYDEDRNEIYTGNKQGLIHVWSN
ncbi:hypothetical protein ACLOJK_025823 [Asimina triloba]